MTWVVSRGKSGDSFIKEVPTNKLQTNIKDQQQR